MAKPKIAIIIGSTRQGRFADKPAEWIAERAKGRGDIDVTTIDLRDHPLPFFEEKASMLYGKAENDAALEWQKTIAGFDGFVMLAAEYNHGPTAVLKNALDYAYEEWNNKPVAFVGYGGVGGARSVEQLRLISIELQMAPIRSAVHILMPDFVAVMKGEKKLAELDHLNQGADAMLDQLIWWTKALKKAREDDAKQAQAA